MRYILFRGKRITNGEWVTGDLMHSHRPPHRIIHSNGRFPGVEESTVGQYAGYNDATSTEVFEDDIVEFPIREYDEDSGIMYEWVHVGHVRFSYGQWSVYIPKVGASTNLHGINSRKLTVIGNVHDNPELLKGAEK